MSKPATLRDVARAAGISPATASLALNGKTCIAPKTRDLVLQTAQQLGYEADFFAQGLRRRGSHQIGLFSLSLDLGVDTHKVQQIQSLLHSRGFDVPIHAYGFPAFGEVMPQGNMMASLCRQRPRAIICHTSNLRAEALTELQRYAESGGIVVAFDQAIDFECDQVIFDREHYTYLAARHLLELGHRKIGLFTEGPWKVTDPIRCQYLAGFQTALREYGVPLQEEWLWNGGRPVQCEEGGEEFAAKFVKMKNRPTGLCMVNDYAAMAFIAEVQRLGLHVPEDVSVVGHDDRPIAKHAVVPLTSVSYPVDEIADQVVKLLESRLNGSYDGPPRHVVSRSKLVERQSSAAPRES